MSEPASHGLKVPGWAVAALLAAAALVGLGARFGHTWAEVRRDVKETKMVAYTAIVMLCSDSVMESKNQATCRQLQSWEPLYARASASAEATPGGP